MGFDNLANMFYHFVVVGSKMTITPIPQKAGESSTFIYGIKVSGATSLPAYTPAVKYYRIWRLLSRGYARRRELLQAAQNLQGLFR